MKKFIVLVAFILFCAVSTVSEPTFLAKNNFLQQFVNHEILALLAIILAITFASMANIHLALNRIVMRAFGRRTALGQRSSEAVRREINSNAWWLFWAFIVCVISLIVKGSMPDHVYIVSAMNGVALTVLLLNVLVFYDIYRAIFAIVGSGVDSSEDSDDDSKFDPEIPPAGQ